MKNYISSDDSKSLRTKSSTSITWCFLLLKLAFVSLIQAEENPNTYQFNFTSYSQFSSSGHQSFWLNANRYGIFDDRSYNVVGILSGHKSMNKESLWDWGFGMDALGRAGFQNDVYLHQAYLESRLGPVQFMAGRKEKTLGETVENLSSGSLAMSANARPIPRLELSVPEYIEVPYTFGYLHIKGHFAHGWLNDDRYAKGAYFHDKSAYAKIQLNPNFQFYKGIVHLSIWGGETEIDGKLPSSFSDFFRVITARAGSENAPANEVNALGFHSGIFDWGLKWNYKKRQYHLYYHHVFTDGSGMKYKNLGDGLFGLGIKNPFSFTYINAVVFEIMNTRDQSGPGISDPRDDDWPDFCEERNCGFRYNGRDNYYNNSIYRSGLSYYEYSIGSPLFMTQRQLDFVSKGIETYTSDFFVSNRNLSHHLGITGKISNALSYRFLGTYVKYYGTYSGKNMGDLSRYGWLNPENNPEDYYFNPSRNQWYFLLETYWKPPSMNNFKFIFSAAFDRGHLFNNQGFMLGVNYRFHPQ
jgi:hypothetical protein